MLESLSQKAVSLKVDLQNLDNLKEETAQGARVRQVARLASLGLPRAGSWLNSTPITALGLKLRPNEFVMASRLSLGCPVYELEGPCPLCLQPSDRYGDHALCCGTGGERITRHNTL